MPDREAEAVVVHVHRGEHGSGGHPGLSPARTGVGGEQDVATLADHHQPGIARGPVEQKGLDRERRLDRFRRTCAGRHRQSQQHDKRETLRVRTAPRETKTG